MKRRYTHIIKAAVMLGLLAAAGQALAQKDAAAVDTATVTTSTKQPYGAYLVDSDGYSLYMFTADVQGKTSNCYNACAKVWPPVLTQGDPKAAGMADKELLGTIKRKSGARQVTYNGWPLYYFKKDQAPGRTEGQDVHGFGGEWYLLSPEGEPIHVEDHQSAAKDGQPQASRAQGDQPQASRTKDDQPQATKAKAVQSRANRTQASKNVRILVGKQVRNRQGEQFGRLVGVVVDASGRVQAIVVSPSTDQGAGKAQSKATGQGSENGGYAPVPETVVQIPPQQARQPGAATPVTRWELIVGQLREKLWRQQEAIDQLRQQVQRLSSGNGQGRYAPTPESVAQASPQQARQAGAAAPTERQERILGQLKQQLQRQQQAIDQLRQQLQRVGEQRAVTQGTLSASADRQQQAVAARGNPLSRVATVIVDRSGRVAAVVLKSGAVLVARP